jgi:hypothetical protein
MALAARCGDGVIVLLDQGDPPHPKTAPSLQDMADESISKTG